MVIDQSEYIEDRPVPGPFPAFPMTKREKPWERGCLYTTSVFENLRYQIHSFCYISKAKQDIRALFIYLYIYICYAWRHCYSVLKNTYDLITIYAYYNIYVCKTDRKWQIFI
jgi:hypothetical protein